MGEDENALDLHLEVGGFGGVGGRCAERQVGGEPAFLKEAGKNTHLQDI